jgi:hypothetical protein
VAIGRQFAFEEERDPSGVVEHRLVPYEQVQRPGAQRGPGDMRVHYTLSGAYGANNPFRIVAGQPIDIQSPLPFTKYQLMVVDAEPAYVGFDRRPGSVAGSYDAKNPGNATMEERVEPSGMISILFAAVPASPVEVTLYAGVPALPA